jgi:hypothetical protein
MTTLPPPDPTALSAAVGAVTDTQTNPASATPPDRCYAVVVSIQLGSPTTLTVQVSGSTVDVPAVRFATSYSPVVGQTVVCDNVNGDLVVAYSLNGGAGANGGPVPLGTLIALDYALSDPAWILCIGGTFSSVTYPDLYAARGNSNAIPDLRGVTLMGAGANGVTLGTRDPNGKSEAHVHGSGGSHTHTGPSHTHTGPSHSHSHNHAGLTHSHSHNHGPATGTGFLSNQGSAGAVAATFTGSDFPSTLTDTDATTASPTTDTDATTGGTGATGASGTAATGATDPGNTASYGSGTANVPPQYGVNVYMRAL